MICNGLSILSLKDPLVEPNTSLQRQPAQRTERPGRCCLGFFDTKSFAKKASRDPLRLLS